MTDIDTPDLFDASLECLAHRNATEATGARHTHVCRRFPEHEPPHVCHRCGATWTTLTEAAA